MSEVETVAPEAKEAEPKKYHTCKVTLVCGGFSDRVIKVYPAEHAKEEVWLDNQPGIERWKAIERLLNGFAPRGTAVPKPIAYHNGKDLRTIVITEEDIPLVRLDGAVLEKPKDHGQAVSPAPKLNPAVDSLQHRMAAMEKSQVKTDLILGQVLDAVKGIGSGVGSKKRGRPKKKA